MPWMWIFGIGGLVALVVCFLVFYASLYRKVDQGQALIINKMRLEPEVTFTGGVVLPIFHRAEIMDISVRRLEIDRRGKEGLICQDNIRADIKVNFFVRVNKTAEDVLKVAQSIGVKRATDQRTLEDLFIAKFGEALKTVGKRLDFEDLYTRREEFRDQIVAVIGRNLNGYVLDDCAIDYLEQTPLSTLDEDNILDAQGIRKITEITAREKINTNQFENDERKRIKQQDVEADEAIFELERQRADAEAKQQREIATVQARETAETEKVRSEERQRSEEARIRADEAIAIQEENKQREVEVAGKNRERVVLVETERVEKDRALEAVSREREVELSRIEKDKALEVEKKQIADVIRERVAVERTVAEEEERINEVRVVEEAKRLKAKVVIEAEAEAEEQLVKDIKAAEAAEKAAQHRARERVMLAEAELEASEKEATAKIRLAEGVQAQEAASGLAEVRVKEADAVAVEKQGLANVRVKEADAEATEKFGAAEASVLRAKMVAEASGIEEKAKAMAALDDATRGHEEYRLRLDKDKEVQLEAIAAQRDIADAQARVLADGLKSARIDIVGGDTIFFDKLVGAMASGKAIDGFVQRSETVSTAAGDYLSGERSFAEDLKDVLHDPSISSADVKDLTVSALLTKLMSRSDGESRDKMKALLDSARKLGLDDTKLS